MLGKQNRLKKNKEFNYVYKKGESVFSKYLGLFYVKTKLPQPKIGFSVSTKVGNSVIRHKIKRRLSAVIESFLNDINTNYNYIFVARDGINELTHDELINQVKYILKKGKVLNNG